MTIPGVVRMPIKKVHVVLDEIGYEGWWVDLRLNPRSEYYDMWFSDDTETSWKGFGQIVIAWNWGDEEGEPLPLPKDGLKQDQLPIDVFKFVFNKYIEALREQAGLPKAPAETSNGTSQTEKSPQSDSVA